MDQFLNVVWNTCTIGLGYLTLKHLPLRKILEGEPVVLIQNGKILEKNLAKLRYHLPVRSGLRGTQHRWLLIHR